MRALERLDLIKQVKGMIEPMAEAIVDEVESFEQARAVWLEILGVDEPTQSKF
ncbi:MAG: hypothetical protein WC356_04605 [Candidatus Micrarchaeia archaeon]|jgi:hypothetical protein